MTKKSTTKLSWIKILIIFFILIALSGAGAMAVATQVNTVTITLANGYEMTVLTSKTNIKEILDENNIVIEDNEKVYPSIDEDISSTGTITITDKSAKEIEIANISENQNDMSLDTLMNTYNNITEKIETVEEVIPFETITKDVSNGSQDTKNKVLQEGVEGKKIVTYKVKYQNETEIERTKISEEVIEEPVNKIVQVSVNKVSSRSETISRSTSTTDGNSTVKIYKVTAYCSCAKCCGSYASGYTSSGTLATAGRTVAAPSNFAFGTQLNINGTTYVVEDRGGAITGNRIDVYVNSHSEALAWGVKYLPVEVEN